MDMIDSKLFDPFPDEVAGDAAGLSVPPASTRETAHTALTAVRRVVATSLDLSQIFPVVAEQAQHILAHDALLVLVAEDAPGVQAGGGLVVAFCQPPVIAANRTWPLTAFSFSPRLLANRMIVVKDFVTSARQHAGDQVFLDLLGPAAVIIPIQLARGVLGALILLSRTPGYYHPRDVLLLGPIAALLALALEHQRLVQEYSARAVVEERDRLAGEIHDSLAQALTGIIVNLEALKARAPGWSRTEAAVLAESEALARSALEEARRAVLDLRPAPLQHQTVAEALRRELARLERTGLTSDFSIQGTEHLLTLDVATTLFRVGQEALQNIYKHATAQHATLTLMFATDVVVLTIADDGKGFASGVAVQDEAGGFGLPSMTARVRSLGGEFHVTSYPGGGTTVRATVPYTPRGGPPPVVQPPPPTTTALVPQSAGARPLTRILVVDDHPIARQGMREILAGQPDLRIVGEAEDGPAALAQMDDVRPDVVLLDLQLPGLSGLEVLPQLRAARPGVEVVIVTVSDQDDQVFAALKAGARGYVLKDAAPDMIVAAVRAASQGETWLPPTVTTRVITQFAVLARREDDPDALTERELEILACMAQDLTYKEVGAQLHITPKTVQYHVTHVLQKLHVSNRSAAVAEAVRRRLIE